MAVIADPHQTHKGFVSALLCRSVLGAVGDQSVRARGGGKRGENRSINLSAAHGKKEKKMVY